MRHDQMHASFWFAARTSGHTGADATLSVSRHSDRLTLLLGFRKTQRVQRMI